MLFSASAQKGVDIAAGPVLAVIKAYEAGKIKEAELGPAIKLARAQAGITAEYTPADIGLTDANGNPTGRSEQGSVAEQLARNAAGKPGIKPSTADVTGMNADASTFQAKYASEANQAAITADRNASTSALAAAHLAQTIDPSNLTPWLAKNANTLNGLGIKIAAGEANKLATYQNLLSQNVKNGIAVFPKNQAEFHAITGALPDMKTPGDAAALTLTTLAAVKAQAAAEKQFRIDWTQQNHGHYSERDFQEAWAKQPGANQSVFASPLFTDLKINGQPAVKIYKPYTDGHVYGAFMPGTKQATKFLVR